jgi:hypothetical protein
MENMSLYLYIYNKAHVLHYIKKKIRDKNPNTHTHTKLQNLITKIAIFI